MKTTITFEGDSAEDRHDLNLVINAIDYVVALDEIKSKVRQMWKHGDMDDSAYSKVEEIYDFICDATSDLE